MNIFIWVTLCGLLIFIIFLLLLIAAVRHGQYDDLVNPQERILWDDLDDRT